MTTETDELGPYYNDEDMYDPWDDPAYHEYCRVQEELAAAEQSDEWQAEHEYHEYCLAQAELEAAAQAQVPPPPTPRVPLPPAPPLGDEVCTGAKKPEATRAHTNPPQQNSRWEDLIDVAIPALRNQLYGVVDTTIGILELLSQIMRE